MPYGVPHLQQWPYRRCPSYLRHRWSIVSWSAELSLISAEHDQDLGESLIMWELTVISLSSDPVSHRFPTYHALIVLQGYFAGWETLNKASIPSHKTTRNLLARGTHLHANRLYRAANSTHTACRPTPYARYLLTPTRRNHHIRLFSGQGKIRVTPCARFIQLQIPPHRLSPAFRSRDNVVKRHALLAFPAAILAPVTNTPSIQTKWAIFGLLVG